MYKLVSDNKNYSYSVYSFLVQTGINLITIPYITGS
nr:MAG TPA: hypothetical protein [Caudoviricetes sp.]